MFGKDGLWRIGYDDEDGDDELSQESQDRLFDVLSLPSYTRAS